MLTLYYKPTCPYSQRVIATAEELGVSFDLKDISVDEVVRQKLIQHGGKKQVPYLIDHEREVSLYESEDIVDYLWEHYAPTGKERKFAGVRVHRSDTTCDVCE